MMRLSADIPLLKPLFEGAMFISLSLFSGIGLADQQDDFLEHPSPRSFLNEEEIEWLNQHPEIYLGVDPSWKPFEFIDEKKRYRGIASDYIDVIKGLLQIEMKPKPNLSWHRVIEEAKSGEIDVLPSVVKTPQREKYLNFTKPYLKFPMVILTRTDDSIITGLKDLKGSRIGVVHSYATFDLISKDYPKLELIEVINIEEGLIQLSEGKLDAFVDNLASITSSIQTLGITNIKVAAQTPYSFDLSIGVRKDWPELIDILNKTLDAIPEHQKNSINSNWISIRYEYGLDIPYVMKLVLVIGFILLIIFGITIYSNRKLYAEIERRMKVEKELELLVDTDPLTGLYNRRFFNQLFQKEFSRAKRDGHLFIYAMMDLDHFKEYNDLFGHQAGDNALKRISDLFKRIFKRAGDTCFRLGGEEFGALLVHMPKEQVASYFESVREAVENLKIKHPSNPASEYLTLSIGYVMIEDTKIISLDEIYKMADTALYLAKDKGKNKVAAYNPTIKLTDAMIMHSDNVHPIKKGEDS